MSADPIPCKDSKCDAVDCANGMVLWKRDIPSGDLATLCADHYCKLMAKYSEALTALIVPVVAKPK